MEKEICTTKFCSFLIRFSNNTKTFLLRIILIVHKLLNVCCRKTKKNQLSKSYNNMMLVK